MTDLNNIGARAKSASHLLSGVSTCEKNRALLRIAAMLSANSASLLAENQKDLKKAREMGMPPALLDRLTLTEERLLQMADAVKAIAALEDPIGEVDRMWQRPNGLTIGNKRVPLGVVGIIYEARPNVTVDAAALCLKAGNAVVLRGGSEALHSNLALCALMSEALCQVGLPDYSVQLLEDTSRETATAMMRLNAYIDVLIPRGGAGLIQAVVQNATVPVIETGVGNCHIYVDEHAELNMAIEIVVNAKTSRLGVCNAAENLLVDCAVAQSHLPKIACALTALSVDIRGCKKTVELLSEFGITSTLATEEDYHTEFLDAVIAVKIVDGIAEAIEHINHYGSGHSEAIVTHSYDNAMRFHREIDAAAVYVNASTRFTDGAAFGFGAEIGISTQKLHVRGPMGLKALTTNKYIVFGNGQVR
ncbi:glutamate-5-semialdehyde dehydrogenase [Fusibacter sp. JL298sf-3]